MVEIYSKWHSTIIVTSSVVSFPFELCCKSMALQDVTSKYANKTVVERRLIIKTGLRLEGEFNVLNANREVRYSEIKRRIKSDKRINDVIIRFCNSKVILNSTKISFD